MKPFLKKLKQIGVVLLLLLMSVFASLSKPVDVQAQTVTITTAHALNFSGNVWRYDANGYGTFSGYQEYIYANGQLAFCIEPAILAGTGAGYTQSSFNRPQQDLFSRIIYHGYDNTGKTAEDYTLTQYALWLNIPGTRIPDIALVLPNFQARYDALMAKVNNHTKVSSFDGQAISLKVGESITLTDTNGTLSQSSVVNNGGFQISQNGNQVTITALSTSGASGTITWKKFPNITNDGPVTPILYSHPTQQDLISGGNPDPRSFSITVNVEQNGNLSIAKVNEQGRPVANTSFNVSSNANMSNPTLVTTNAQGTASLTGITAGTYYVQETSVPAPYVLDTTVHTVNVTAGQTATFTQTNKEAQGKISVTKVDNDNNTYQGAVYNILNASGTVVQTITTGANGIATSKTLPLGTYTVVETSAPNPLLLDPTPITVTLTYANQTTPIVSQAVTQTNDIAQGQITITKNGENEVLQGAEYDVLDGNQEVVDHLITGANGQATTKELPLGTYTLVETSVPEPYVLDPTPIEASLVYENQTTSVVKDEVTQSNIRAVGNITIRKTDSEYPDVVLADGVYEILSLPEREVVDTITTDNQGQAQSINLPLGEYLVKEITPPVGFLLDEQEHLVELVYENQTTPVVNTHLETVDEPIKGQIQVVKVDSNNEEIPVEGAVFEVYKLPEREVVETITSDVDGFAYTSLLRYGDYIVKEIEAPVEFYINPNEYPVSIREHEKVEVQYIRNDAILIKLNINKTASDTGLPLAETVFEITNKETGELVTFEYLNDDYELVTQTQLVTNAQGQAFTRGFLPYETYVVTEVSAPKGYVRANPIEFVVDRDTEFVELDVIGATSVVDISNDPTLHHLIKVDIYGNPLEGATLQLVEVESQEVIAQWVSDGTPLEVKGLEIGKTYRLEELEAPVEYLLSDPVEFVVEETADLIEVVMVDEWIPLLETTALFDDGLKESLPKETLKVIDVVDYDRVVVGKEYTVKGQLLDVETQEVIATGETTFVAEEESGSVEVVFEVDGSHLIGQTLVVFEDLYDGERLVATHSELTDENQTVRIPEIGTTATDLNGLKEVLPLEKVTLIDVVEYTNLTPNTEYTLKGELVRKDTQEVIATNELVFIPETTSGHVELEFTFDASQLKGQEVVVFEDVFVEETLIATHRDLEDQGQTVRVINPSIQTLATDDEGYKVVLPHQEVTIRDRVDYTDLIPGLRYTLKGQLIHKDTLEVLDESEVSFTSSSKNGVVELEFTFNASELRGSQVVVFEELIIDDLLLALHKDLEDVHQTVTVTDPEIGTTATPRPRTVENPTQVTIQDEVSYRNLVVGKEYTVKGVLMDKSTEEPFLVNGEEVTSEVTFVAEETSGSVFLDFVFDGSALQKTSVVVFEALYEDEQLIATHADINDDAQTVHFVEIMIRKVDSLDSKKVLKDAEFTLYQNDLAIQTKATDENGLAHFVVEPGDWTLKETKAPNGYQLPKEPTQISVTGKELNSIITITLMNTPIETLALTGFDNPWVYGVSGSILISAGLLLLLKKKRQA